MDDWTIWRPNTSSGGYVSLDGIVLSVPPLPYCPPPLPSHARHTHAAFTPSTTPPRTSRDTAWTTFIPRCLCEPRPGLNGISVARRCPPFVIAHSYAVTIVVPRLPRLGRTFVNADTPCYLPHAAHHAPVGVTRVAPFFFGHTRLIG